MGRAGINDQWKQPMRALMNKCRADPIIKSVVEGMKKEERRRGIEVEEDVTCRDAWIPRR